MLCFVTYRTSGSFCSKGFAWFRTLPHTNLKSRTEGKVVLHPQLSRTLLLTVRSVSRAVIAWKVIKKELSLRYAPSTLV